ncbi:MAG: hypothetical protein V1894_00940 [Chloroflexota bacterium]
MKRFSKRIYCPNCQRLVRWNEQKAGNGTQFLCQRCGKLIWLKEGLAWKYAKSVKS